MATADQEIKRDGIYIYIYIYMGDVINYIVVKLWFTIMFYVGFNSVSNFIIILFNYFPVFLWDLI